MKRERSSNLEEREREERGRGGKRERGERKE